MTTAASPLDDAFVQACSDMVHRTGATSMQVRYSKDEHPTVWIAVAEYHGKYEACGALTIEKALMRLLETLVDGGQCKHCQRPTGITSDIDEQLLGQLVCWYQLDPELNTFRRGCA